MAQPATNPRIVQFGLFELDLDAHELRKAGVRIKLQEQPFQILAMLLEHPGEIVTREQLQRKLWPEDTFVDFDLSLNSAVKKLRQALGDDSENPRFIETLYRRGYRFLAQTNGAATLQAPVTATPIQVQLSPEPLPAKTQRIIHPALAWLVSALAILIAVLVWLAPPLPPPRILGSKQLTNDGFLKVGLVTDGNRLYFRENPPGRFAIAQVSTSGGEVARIDVPFPTPVLFDISPKSSELLVAQTVTAAARDEIPLWSIPIPAGSARRLGVVAYSAEWMPNNELMLGKGHDIYVAEHDGANPRKLVTVVDSPGFFHFSPDGKRVRFSALNPTAGTSALWEMQADGSSLHPILAGWNHPSNECCGAWTSNGNYYVFQSVHQGSSNIWIVADQFPWWKKASREPVQLTTGPLQFSYPLPTKDGKELFVIGTQSRAELVRYDAKSQDFVPFLGGISASDVEFSRENRWVTYVDDSDYTLWRSKADGSERLQLTFSPMTAALAHWSPDGKKIAFSGATASMPVAVGTSLGTSAWSVYVISKDGGSPERIPSDPKVWAADPTWSSDGTKLAFGSTELTPPLHSSIQVFDLNTHQISKLPGSDGIFGPRWSPDGRYILALAFDGNALMLYDCQKSSWKKLDVAGLDAFGYMTWSPDSSSVYFDTTVSKSNGFYRLRVNDSKLEKVADLTKIRRFSDLFSTGSYWSGLGPGEMPLFSRDISTQEIYSFDLQLP